MIYNADCLEILNTISNNSIDCIITDPPYGIRYNSNHRINKKKSIENDNQFFLPINILWNKLKEDGLLLFFFSQKNWIVDSRIKDYIVWIKNNHTAGDLKQGLGNKYEMIAYCPKKEYKFPHKRPTNVIMNDKVIIGENQHPTEKPIELLEKMILLYTKEDDVILDPFMGTGSTIVASKNLKRKYIGIEIEENYFNIAKERLSQEILF